MNDLSGVRSASVPQDRFIRTVLHQFIVAGHARDAQLPSGPEWDAVVRLVHLNNLGPLFHFAYQGRQPLPDVFEIWKNERLHLLMSNLHKLKVAVRTFDLLAGNGIRAVGLRGLSLSQVLYPDAGIRPMKDLDILVDADGHDTVVRAMQRGGHTPTRLLRRQVVYDLQGVETELHLALLTTRRYETQFSRDELLGARVRVDTPEGAFYRLSDEHELIELVAHALIHHELHGLFRLLDIGLLMATRPLDWDRIVRWCRSARLSNMYLMTLSLADELFHLRLDLPARFARSLPESVRRSFASYAQLYFGRETLGHYLRRKRNLFFVAETFPLWMRQFLRLFSGSTLRELRQVLGPAPYPTPRQLSREKRTNPPDAETHTQGGRRSPTSTGHLSDDRLRRAGGHAGIDHHGSTDQQ